MTSLNIDLPEPLKVFVELEAEASGEMNDADWEAYKQQYRTRRLEKLRREIALGLSDAALGREVSADEAFRRLEARNQAALDRR